MRILILLLILISCSAPTPLSDNLGRVSNKAVCLVEKKLPIFNNGIGRMNQDGKIKAIELSFIHKDPMTIQEARWLLLSSFKISLDSIQQDQKIREYLLDDSFNINNLIISIRTNSRTQNELPDELVTDILIIKGVIHYDRFDWEADRFVTIHEETYEEALQKCSM